MIKKALYFYAEFLLNNFILFMKSIKVNVDFILAEKWNLYRIMIKYRIIVIIRSLFMNALKVKLLFSNGKFLKNRIGG